MRVDAPLWWVPQLEAVADRPVFLLDARSVADAFHVGVGDARVLADFAEEVLAVNELQWSPEEGLERKSTLIEFFILALRDELDDVGFVETAEVAEALRDAVERAWSGNNE